MTDLFATFVIWYSGMAAFFAILIPLSEVVLNLAKGQEHIGWLRRHLNEMPSSGSSAPAKIIGFWIAWPLFAFSWVRCLMSRQTLCERSVMVFLKKTEIQSRLARATNRAMAKMSSAGIGNEHLWLVNIVLSPAGPVTAYTMLVPYISTICVSHLILETPDGEYQCHRVGQVFEEGASTVSATGSPLFMSDTFEKSLEWCRTDSDFLATCVPGKESQRQAILNSALTASGST